MDVNKFTLVEHMAELRKRLLIIITFIILSTIVCYFFVEPLFESVIAPAQEKFDFIYISPPELFMSYVKVSLVAGIIMASPIIFYEVWAFVKPGLEKRQRNPVIFSLLGGLFFFTLGVVFCYKIVCPIVIQFFFDLTIEVVTPMISVGNYISFIATLLLGFGLIFELPMVVVILSSIGIITPKFLKENRKYFILIIFIVAAMITPPDVISQILLAIPMMLLYEVSIFFSKIAVKKRYKKISEITN